MQKVNNGAGPNPYDKRRKGRGVGRPNKITPEMIEMAVKTIESGAMLGLVPALMGIGTSAFYDWMRRGTREINRLSKLDFRAMGPEEKKEARAIAKKEAIYAKFSQSVQTAISKRDKGLIDIIQRAAQGSPKVVRKVKKELLTTAQGTDEGPIINKEMVITEETETKTVEYDWRAAQYLLEKGNPAIFGPRATIDIKQVLPSDPTALAQMELPELLALAQTIEDQLQGLTEE